MSQSSLKIKKTGEGIACAVLIAVAILAIRSLWVRVETNDVKHVANARADIKDRHGTEALKEAERIVNSILSYDAINVWSDYINKEIN